MAKTRNLKINQGATWAWAIGVNLDGVPLDTGWTATAQIRESVSASGILYTLNGVVTEGSVTFSVPANVSTGWAWRVGVYSLEISKDSTTHRICSGTVFVSPEGTR